MKLTSKRAWGMDDDVMLAYAALAADLRDDSDVTRVAERLNTACLDLAHANSLVSFSASGVLEIFFDHLRKNSLGVKSSPKDLVCAVIDLLIEVAKGECVSGEAQTHKHDRNRGAARACTILRGALKRESKRRYCKVQSEAQWLEIRFMSRVFARRVSVKLAQVVRCAGVHGVKQTENTNRHESIFLWKAEALRLACAARVAVDAFNSSKQRTEDNLKDDLQIKSRVDAAVASSAVIKLTADAFSGPVSTPAYYTHASFTAASRLFNAPPRKTIVNVIKSGALRWPTNLVDGPFEIEPSGSPPSNTPSTYRRAWLLFFKGGRLEDLELDPDAAWPAPNQAASTQALLNVFAGEDDCLVEFLECVLLAADAHDDVEGIGGDGRSTQSRKRPRLEGNTTGWRGTANGPDPGSAFLALMVELGWDCDTVFNMLCGENTEKAQAVFLGYFARAVEFVETWDHEHALRVKEFSKSLIKKLDGEVELVEALLLTYICDALDSVKNSVDDLIVERGE